MGSSCPVIKLNKPKSRPSESLGGQSLNDTFYVVRWRARDKTSVCPGRALSCPSLAGSAHKPSGEWGGLPLAEPWASLGDRDDARAQQV